MRARVDALVCTSADGSRPRRPVRRHRPPARPAISASSAARARTGVEPTPNSATPARPSVTAHATPANAKSPCRRGHLPRSRSRCAWATPESARDQQFVGFGGGRPGADEEVVGRDQPPRPPAPTSSNSRAERHRDRRVFRRGIGVRERPAHRAPIADLEVPDERRGRARSGTAAATTGRAPSPVAAFAARTTSVPFSRSTPARSPTRLTSTRCSKCVRRNASIGTRLCPPASTLASSPCSASNAHTSSTVSGAWYSNGAGFMPREPICELTPASGLPPCVGSRTSIDRGLRAWPIEQHDDRRHHRHRQRTDDRDLVESRHRHREMTQVVHEMRHRVHEPRDRGDAGDRADPDDRSRRSSTPAARG